MTVRGAPAEVEVRHHVTRLQVAVDDVGFVKGLQAIGDLANHPERFLRFHRAFPLQMLGECFAGQKLHRQEGDVGAVFPGVAAYVENPADVGMGDPAGELDLAFEAGHVARVG